MLDDLLSPKLLKQNQSKYGTIFQVLGGYKDFTLYKQLSCDGFKYVKKKDNLLRRKIYKVYEVVTGICGVMVDNASNESFIKSRYHSSTCNNSCNYEVNLKKRLVDLLPHGSINISVKAHIF